MHTFEWLIVLLLGAIALSALARRWGLPYPAFLAVGGAGLALLPIGPTFVLDPTLALALFVAPILLNEAYDASLRDLRAYWLPISFLVIAAVLLTTGAVALAAKLMLPDLPWAAAVALGAIVAPPDATAASAVLRFVNLPYRISTILAGESLLNDASALFLYRLAVAAVVTGSFGVGTLAKDFTLVLPISLAVGWAAAAAATRIIDAIDDVPSSIITQFALTFGLWISAEALNLSSVLTIVAYAICISRSRPRRFGARLRIPAYAVWDTATFLLNVLAFLLTGLQLRPILNVMPENEMERSFAFAAIIMAVCMLTRMAWVFGYFGIQQRRIRRDGWRDEQSMRPTARSSLVVSWCGMRGIVTLAAAFALPDGHGGSAAFPHRELMLLTAFTVVFGTLVLQGLTLKPLVSWAKLRDHDLVGREIGLARAAVFRDALAEIEGEEGAAVDALRNEYTFILDEAEAHPDGFAPAKTEQDDLRLRTIAAARRKLYDMRGSGEIGNGAFSQIEAELDQAEMHASA